MNACFCVQFRIPQLDEASYPLDLRVAQAVLIAKPVHLCHTQYLLNDDPGIQKLFAFKAVAGFHLRSIAETFELQLQSTRRGPSGKRTYGSIETLQPQSTGQLVKSLSNHRERWDQCICQAE
ncbi:unnamed protein product [Schistocephalus solidus]|uniref:Transposase n=1 Tax=Schistocephalus solidus TaxID=70667 RepID=A0A183SXH0_SCHSO|nr:unnamed protein product [Schistocephalus solidus]